MHAFTTSSRLSAQSVYAWVLDQYFWAHILLVHECSAVHTSTQCVHMRASFLGFHLSIKPRLDATRHIPFLFCLPIPLDLAQVALSCFTPAYALFIPTHPPPRRTDISCTPQALNTTIKAPCWASVIHIIPTPGMPGLWHWQLSWAQFCCQQDSLHWGNFCLSWHWQLTQTSNCCSG